MREIRLSAHEAADLADIMQAVCRPRNQMEQAEVLQWVNRLRGAR